MKIKFYETLPDEVVLIREKVFVHEQRFKDEFDKIDSIARHLVIYVDDIAVATGKISSK